MRWIALSHNFSLSLSLPLRKPTVDYSYVPYISYSFGFPSRIQNHPRIDSTYVPQVLHGPHRDFRL